MSTNTTSKLPIDDLIQQACSDTDPQVTHAALDQLIINGQRDALVQVYDQAFNEGIRGRTVEALGALGSSKDRAVFFTNLLHREYSPTVRLAGVRTFYQEFPVEALDALTEMLDPRHEPYLRAEAAALLNEGQAALPEPPESTINTLYSALVWATDPAVNPSLSAFLKAKSDANTKLTLLIGHIEQSPWVMREGFDSIAAAWSLDATSKPAVTQEIADQLVRRIQEADWSDRVIGVLASLLVAVVGNRDQAARSINRLAERENLSESSLRSLRLELGGRIALKPILEEAENEFAKPLKDLFTKTMADWEAATRSARIGFALRITMSVVVFVAGLVVTIVSSYQVIFASQGDELWGPGASMAVGLGAMLTVVYKSPLSDVKTSVTDLADTDIAFITFMHRLQFTTGLIQSDFAHGRMTPEGVSEAGKALGESMDDWAKLIHRQSAVGT